MYFRISGQKINIVKVAKYLGLKLDQHPTFKQHMDTIKPKLNRANSLLAKIRFYVDSKLLKTIYTAIFDFFFFSVSKYGCLVKSLLPSRVKES